MSASIEAAMVGQPRRRVEDNRLTTGHGQYVDDITLPGVTHVAFVRSPLPHAAVTGISAAAARAVPGVVEVFTARDLGKANAPLYNIQPHPAMAERMQRPLAADRVRYVGDPVVVVVAESRAVAEDAAELVEVDYEPLEPVINLQQAGADSSPLVHDDCPNNLVARIAVGFGDYAAAAAAAAAVVEGEFMMDRCSGSPVECRAVLAQVTAGDRQNLLTVWCNTQMPHEHRRAVAAMLGESMESVRLIAPDVGGGFGIKAPLYPEEILIPWLAREIARPVKWTEDRTEHFVGSNHGRGQIHHAQLAVDADGHILGIRDRFQQDNGAYTSWGLTKPLLTAQAMLGPYRVRAYEVTGQVLFTNLPPVSPYRGAGRPQGVFVLERLLDAAARQLGIDPAEMRRRNFIQPDEFPFEFPMIGRDGQPLTYDSGNYPGNFAAALELFDYEQRSREARAARKRGRYVGVGVAFALEKSGLGPHEGALIRVDPGTGRVFVYTGASTQGQGQETMLAQVVADHLGADVDEVEVSMGDTNRFPLGVGAIASRIGVVGSNAVAKASQRVREKALQVAAATLECGEDDLDIRAGRIVVRGDPGSGMTLQEVAWTASCPAPGVTHTAGWTPGLEATEFFTPSGVTYGAAAHAVMVEIEPATGKVTILRYAACHDSGRVLNPMILRGQIQGGIAAGIGNALLERLSFSEDGQPITTTYLDYLIPTLADVPDIELVFMETLSPLNPLGVKGAGQAGTLPAPAAIAAAIDDALDGQEQVNRSPITPEEIWRMVRTRADARAAREPGNE
jgi:carbon-monoxide dehydrogenase large subunit